MMGHTNLSQVSSIQNLNSGYINIENPHPQNMFVPSSKTTFNRKKSCESQNDSSVENFNQDLRDLNVDIEALVKWQTKRLERKQMKLVELIKSMMVKEPKGQMNL